MKWARIKAFAAAELKTTFRERGVVFWMIIWPVLLTLMVAYVFIPPGLGSPVTLDLGVVNLDTSDAPFNGTSFVAVLKEVEFNGTKLFNVKEYGNESSLLEDLRKGKLDAGIVIPEGFGRNLTFSQASLKVYVSADNPYSSQINKGFMQAFLSEFSKRVAIIKVNTALNYSMNYVPENVTLTFGDHNVSLRDFMRAFFIGLAVPINASIEDVTPEAIKDRPSVIGWYTIGAIGMVLLYGGFTTGALAVHADKERGTLRRILSTPATIADMLAGKTLAGIITLAISSVAVIATGVAVGAKFMWSPTNPVDWLVVAHLLMVALMTIGIGMLLAVPARTARGASSLGTSLGLILAFTTGVWFPKEWMPGPMRMVADVSPITMSLDVVRKIMIWRATPQEIMGPTLIVAAFTIAVFAAGVMTYNRMIRKLIEE